MFSFAQTWSTIVNDFELIQTMHLNAKLKTVNKTKYIKDAIFTHLCGHDQCTEPWITARHPELRLGSQSYGSAPMITQLGPTLLCADYIAVFLIRVNIVICCGTKVYIISVYADFIAVFLIRVSKYCDMLRNKSLYYICVCWFYSCVLD